MVPGTLITADELSPTVNVTVRMPYKPKGPKSDWAWLSNRGARWDPCRPITYRINPARSYPAATADIRARSPASAGSPVSAQVPRPHHPSGRPLSIRLYPAGTDVVVDWQSPRQEPGLSGRVTGIGGHWVQGERRFSGYMLLDQTERYPRVVWRQVISHELGHILGLGHARSRQQLMHGTSTTSNRLWGNGDLTALRRVGPSRGCLPSQSQRPVPDTAPVRAEAR